MKMLALMITYILSANATTVDAAHPIVSVAVDNCRYLKGASPKRIKLALEVANILFEVESRYDIPPKLKGMILSAGCVESGFNPKAKGDHRFSKSKKKPMAIGVLQLWKFYEKAYGIDRKDPKASAEAWMKHIARMVPKVKRQCRYRKPTKVWIAAWVTGIRYRKKGGRCKERPKHLRYLKKMHRIYDRLNHSKRKP